MGFHRAVDEIAIGGAHQEIRAAAHEATLATIKEMVEELRDLRQERAQARPLSLPRYRLSRARVSA